MKRTNIYLTESQYMQLAALSDGRSVSEIIRRAIDDFLASSTAKMQSRIKETKTPRPPALSEQEKKRRAQASRYKAKILLIRKAQRENGSTLQQTIDYFDDMESNSPEFLSVLDAMLENNELE